MNLRIEHFDNAEVVYLALEPDGAWARSEFPSEGVTVDFDGADRVIGIEVAGHSSSDLTRDLVEVLVPSAERDAVLAALGAASTEPATGSAA